MEFMCRKWPRNISGSRSVEIRDATILGSRRFADVTSAGGTVMRIMDIIFILLVVVVFSLAIGAFMGLHFSLENGTFYWAT